MAGLFSNFGTRGSALSLGLSLAFFVILTSAVSLILWESTKYRPSGSSASSYSLRLEASNEGEFRDTYSFVQSCIMSESGSPCLPKSTAAAVYPGIFSSVSLPADVKPGRYRGIRVQIAGAHGRSLKVRSITLEGRKLFDGRGALPFRNTKGLSVRSDRRGGFAVLEIQSDSASFDLDCSFSVRGAPPAPVRYTGAVLAAVAFAATILLLSVIGAASRSGKRSLGERRPGAGRIAGRLSICAIIFYLLLSVILAAGQLFLSNELAVSGASGRTERFMAEVSGAADFRYVSGTASFYSAGETSLRIPRRFSAVRISVPADGSSADFSVSARGGSCSLRNGVLSAEGALSCHADERGRLSLDFSGPGSSLQNSMHSVYAALLVLGVMFVAMRLLRFGSAVRLLLVIIMVSAYLTGEIAMNVESGNVVFYRSYLQLLPEVALRNISLIIFIFLLSELSFSHGFICSGTFLEVLLLVIAYVGTDWGVFQNFGVRPDIGTMLSHSGAGGGTVLAFASTFFRTSHASLMVLVMLACWSVMLFSVRLRKDRPLRIYLVLAILINCVPFLKVYENFYTGSAFELRKDIFDIQGSAIWHERFYYTEAFPEWDWKPHEEEIEGLGRRKNVVILLVESLADVYSEYFSGLKGCMPEIDRLAEENASFLNYHSTGMETTPATYSVLTGKIMFSDLDRDEPDPRFEYGDALPRVMAKAGYATSVIYSSENFGGLDDVYKKSGFGHFHGNSDPAWKGVKRYHFRSVADGILLRHASELIRESQNGGKPFLTLIMTSSSHSPFLNPETGKTGYCEVMPYVDREISLFVRRLEESGFFANGTLVITGDHHPPIRGFEPGEVARYGEDLNRVPLIIIDRDIGKRRFMNVFGHDSLRAIVEYLNLPRVRKYGYQLIPMRKEEERRSVTVLCPMIFQNSYLGGIRVSGPNGEQGVYEAKGDRSEFASRFLSPDLEREVAGRVKWLKREE